MTAPSTPPDEQDFYTFNGGDDSQPAAAVSELAPPVKPAPPVAALFVGGVMACGMLAMTTSAYDAFRLATPNWFEAIAKAVLIEGSMVAEAFVIMRRGGRERKVLAGAGGVVSVSVSVTYNYIQAEAYGMINEPWQLWGMAGGPVIAMVSLGLLLGHLWNEYEVAKERWDTYERGETQRKNARAFAKSNDKIESDNIRKAQDEQADKERNYNLALKDKELEAMRLQAEIEKARAAQAQAPQPSLVDSQDVSIDDALTAQVQSMTAQGKSKTEIAWALIEQYGISKAAAARLAGVNASVLSRNGNKEKA